MDNTSEEKQQQEVGLLDIMAEAFPGYQDFKVSSVTPSVMGTEDRFLVSFLVVCNEEAAEDFRKEEEVYADVVVNVQDSANSEGLDLHMTLVFAFSSFSLEFYLAVLAEDKDMQKYFVEKLSKVDKLIVWLVDEEKNLINVLQMNWDYDKHKEAFDMLK